MKRGAAILVSATALVLGGSGAAWAGGGNSTNAHSCQHGGWTTMTDSNGNGFANEGACTSYGAHGGTYGGTSGGTV